MGNPDKYELEKVPGLSQTVRQVLADVRKGVAASSRWNHPRLQRDAKDLARRIEEYAEKQQLNKIPDPYEKFQQLWTSAALVPEILNDFKRLEPVIDGLKKTDPKNHATATARLKEARDSFANGGFVACNTVIEMIRMHNVPGGPKYEPSVSREEAAATPLAPRYKTRKTALEADVKRALTDRSGKADAYKDEAGKIDLFFRKQARGDLNRKLAEIDSKAPGKDRQALIGKAILIVQDYINGFDKSVPQSRLGNSYVETLREVHAALKKRYIP